MYYRGALGSVLVLIGGLVTQVLPGSSPVMSLPLLADLRAAQPARLVGLAVVVAGLALLGSAWLRLTVRVRPDDGRPVAVRLQSVHLATAVWSAPLLVAPPLFSRDGWSYAAQGALTHDGLSPYIWTPSIFEGQIREAVDPIWLHTRTPYGPLPLMWGSWLAALTDDPWLMVIGYRLLGVLGLVLLAWAVPRLARRGGQDPARASAIVLAGPLTVVHGIGGVHNDLLMAGLMAAALAVAVDGRWASGAALAGAAAAVKVPGGAVAIGVALVSLPLLVALWPRLRRLVTVGLVAAAVVVAWGAAIGVGVGWIHALTTPGLVRTPLAATTQIGAVAEHTATLLGLETVAAGVVTALRTGGLLAAVGYAAYVALRGRTGDPTAAIRSTGLVITAMVVLGPAVHAWYLLWSLPFLAACRWSRPVEQLVRDAVLLLGLVAPLDSSLRGAPTEIAVVVTLIVLTVIRLRLYRPRTDQADRSERSGSLVAPWTASISPTVRDHG